MLIGQRVEEPCAGGLHLLLLVSHALPVPELVPLLIVNDALLQIGLSLLVLLQRVVCLADLLHANTRSQSAEAVLYASNCRGGETALPHSHHSLCLILRFRAGR